VHRIEYRDIENENRFALVDEVCEFITTQECHSCIITSTPLLYQIRDDISQNIVDVTTWNRISDKIDYAHYSIYLVLDFEKDYIATRYNCTIELNKFIKVHETTNGTSIYKYFEE
jgi:hypothetical protein